ncbi:hypothetical protein [Nostoc sp. NMS4]|uniref:hypothetical protein n=1 Tax=Nostoc sp. NMS4 TaxID=2815390 RepID=UPI0025DD0D6B|nr:hypothetical protein [Nostoc sp. NMS4]MBN3922491.1 hypothetical protein [Nostoc sp. NMS4]
MSTGFAKKSLWQLNWVEAKAERGYKDMERDKKVRRCFCDRSQGALALGAGNFGVYTEIKNAEDGKEQRV